MAKSTSRPRLPSAHELMKTSADGTAAVETDQFLRDSPEYLATATGFHDDSDVESADEEERAGGARRRVAGREGSLRAEGISDVLVEGNLEAASAWSQVSLRAILAGLGIGSILVGCNMYFGLQTGWVTMASLPSALLAFLLSRLLSWPDFSPQENVLAQTVAVATGTMPLAGGFVGVIPALSMLADGDAKDLPEDVQNVVLGTGQMLLWTFALAFFGVFFAVLLRRGVIVRERLPFPSGTATALMIKVLHTSGKSHTGGPPTRPLLLAFAASAGYTILSFFVPVLYNLPVGTWVGAGFATRWGWWLTPSLSYVGQGMIMGAHTGLSMLAGSFFGWAILGPYAESQDWCEGVFDWKKGAQGWILWVSLSIMLGESISSFAVFAADAVRSYFSAPGKYTHLPPPASASTPTSGESDHSDPVPPHHLVSTRTAAAGLLVSTMICAAILAPLFDMSVWQVVVAVLAGCLCSIVAVRTLGAIDVNPVSGIGKISQLLFAVVSPGNVVANLVAGAVAEAGAQQAGDMMQDLKTGHLLAASPYAQFIGQLIGTLASIPVTVAAFKLYTSVYTVPGPELAAPTAAVWLDMAKIVNGGHAPPHVAPWCIAGALVGGFLPILDWAWPITAEKLEEDAPTWRQWARKARKWVPSGVGFAIGLYITPNFVLPRVVGGLVAYHWRTRYAPSWQAGEGVITASGFVLGEGIASMMVALMKGFGLGVLTCAGCGGVNGVRCGGCPA